MASEALEDASFSVASAMCRRSCADDAPLLFLFAAAGMGMSDTDLGS